MAMSEGRLLPAPRERDAPEYVTGCQTCDTREPQLTAEAEAWLALHRALCLWWRQTVAALTPWLERLSRALEAAAQSERKS